MHRRAREVWKNLFSSATGTCSLPGTCRRSWSSSSPCWGARLWMKSSILWPCCISKGTSAGQILLPSSHAECTLLTDTEILCTPLSPVSPRAGVTCMCNKCSKVALCHRIPSCHFVQKPSVHSSHCLMEVCQLTLLFGDFDLVIALIDFEG